LKAVHADLLRIRKGSALEAAYYARARPKARGVWPTGVALAR
jgi:hypothetical protein